MDAPTPETGASTKNRVRAAKAVAPLLGLAAFNLTLILWWGIEPLWGFAMLPPILMVCAFAWIYFSADHENSDGH